MRVLLIARAEPFYHFGAFFKSALTEMGIEHAVADFYKYVQPLEDSLVHKVAFRLLRRRPLTYWALNRNILETAREFRPNIILVTTGPFISASTLISLREKTGAFLINYCIEDPYNPANSTRDLLAGIPLYDLFACTKKAIMDDVQRAGARNVAYVPVAYEPSLFFPESPASEEEREKFACDVAFIGTADPDRFVLLNEIRERLPGIRLQLYGSFWDRDPYLRRIWKGHVVGKDHRLAIGGARICLGILRRTNRDTITDRSFQIPACRGFMVAERSNEHEELLAEGEEAAFYDSTEELVEKVRVYLSRDDERARMANAAYHRVTTGGHTFKHRLEQILSLAEELRSPVPAEVGA